MIFIYFKSNFKVTFINEDFETHSEEKKKSKICTISVAILLFSIISS